MKTRGTLNRKPIKAEEQFTAVDDMKLRISLAALADRYDEMVRDIIYKTYQDNELALLYRALRNSGVYEKGGKVNRKIIEFPNAYVLDFCDTIMTSLYGEDWLNDHRAIKHDLVRPWWVVSKI